MKLKFIKNEKHQIDVVQVIGKNAREFSYVDMIKYLISSNKLDEPETEGEFTPAEIRSILSMTKHINDAVATEVESASKDKG
jgi:hypothetical protein